MRELFGTSKASKLWIRSQMWQRVGGTAHHSKTSMLLSCTTRPTDVGATKLHNAEVVGSSHEVVASTKMSVRKLLWLVVYWNERSE